MFSATYKVAIPCMFIGFSSFLIIAKYGLHEVPVLGPRAISPTVKLGYQNDVSVEKVTTCEKGICASEFDEKLGLWRRYMENVTKTKPEHRLPDAIIIGAEKCGTGALLWFLNEHPLIKVPLRAEMFFFNTDQYFKGIDRYRKKFPKVRKHELVMEKTPAYFKNPSVPARIKRTVPHAKIILLLCDPVNRTYSDFLQHKAMNHIDEDSAFDELVEKYIKNLKGKFENHSESSLSRIILSNQLNVDNGHIVSSGMYYYYVAHWLRTYKLSKNFLILNGEDLLHQPWSIFDNVQDFLKIPKLIIKSDFERSESGHFCIRKWNTDSNNTKMRCMGGSKGRSRLKGAEWDPEPLRKFFAQSNKKLYKLIGSRFDWQ